jgi:hypothetical protein
VASHKDLLSRVALRVGTDKDEPDGAAPAPPGFVRSSPEDRQLLVAFLVHTADLHNPLLPPSMSRRIADELSREFANQAVLERAASLPVTVMLPQSADDAAGKAKMELGFLNFVVAPLYDTFAKIAPSLGAKCLVRIGANRDMWTDIIAEAATAPSMPRAAAVA